MENLTPQEIAEFVQVLIDKTTENKMIWTLGSKNEDYVRCYTNYQGSELIVYVGRFWYMHPRMKIYAAGYNLLKLAWFKECNILELSDELREILIDKCKIPPPNGPYDDAVNVVKKVVRTKDTTLLDLQERDPQEVKQKKFSLWSWFKR